MLMTGPDRPAATNAATLHTLKPSSTPALNRIIAGLLVVRLLRAVASRDVSEPKTAFRYLVKDLTRASTNERAIVPSSSRRGLKIVTSTPTALGLPSAIRRMVSSSDQENPSGNR